MNQSMEINSNASAASLTRLKALTPQPDDLLLLGKFADEDGQAVSFYYRSGGNSHASHDSMLLNLRVRDIITTSFSAKRRTSGLLRDLDHCLEIAEKTPESYPCLCAVFACHDHGIWMEFEIPSSVHVVRVEASNSFNLGPLLRAVEQQELFVSADAETVKVV